MAGRGAAAQAVGAVGLDHHQSRTAAAEGFPGMREHCGGEAADAALHEDMGRWLRALRQRLGRRSEEHTSELQSLMRISYAVFCLKKKKKNIHRLTPTSIGNYMKLY